MDIVVIKRNVGHAINSVARLYQCDRITMFKILKRKCRSNSLTERKIKISTDYSINLIQANRIEKLYDDIEKAELTMCSHSFLSQFNHFYYDVCCRFGTMNGNWIYYSHVQL